VVLSEMANFALALPVLVLVLYATGNPLTPHALWLPVIAGIQLVFTLGLVLALATANVYYRDTAVIMEVVLLAWFFMTPVFYSLEPASGPSPTAGLGGVPAQRLAYILNPMASLIANYRVVLYGSPTGPPSDPALDFVVRTALTAALVLVAGYGLFARHAGRFGEDV
jgi:lipopolysaccharide transport system permease protein